MQDFGIPLLFGLVPILTLLALSLLLSQISLRSLRFRALVCGTPAVLIRAGELQQDAMRRNRYTVDELLEELREQGVTRGGGREVRRAGKLRPTDGLPLDGPAAAPPRSSWAWTWRTM